MRKRDYLKIQKTKYLHVFRCTRLCSRAPHQLVKYTALCDIVHCNLRLLFIILFVSIKRSVLFHPITHSPSCKHLTSPLSFQHQFTRISGSPRSVTRLPLPNSPCLEHYSAAFSSFHPFCTTPTLILQYHRFSQYFSLCSSVVSSLASFLLFISPQFTIPSPPTPCTNPLLPPLL